MADESYWTYQAATATPSYWEAQEIGAISDKMTEAGWQSLTPGMRREIVRSYQKQQAKRVAPVSRQAELDIMQSEPDNGDRFY